MSGISRIEPVVLFKPLEAKQDNFKTRAGERSAINSGDLLVNVLPGAVDLEKIVYKPGKKIGASH